MTDQQKETGPALPGVEGPPDDLTFHETWIPPASVVGDFVLELPGLAAQLPGTVGEVIGGLSELLPDFDIDREMG